VTIRPPIDAIERTPHLVAGQFGQYVFDMADFLGHPMLLLLVGAAFSTLLPRHWQRKQKQSSIRTNLVADMSECVMEFVTDLRNYYKLGRGGESRGTADSPEPQADHQILSKGDLKKSYREFDVRNCVIHTKLEIYYPEHAKGVDIPTEWKNFADSLIVFYWRLDVEAHPKVVPPDDPETTLENLLKKKVGIIQKVTNTRPSVSAA
jgi:hypothetical protein